MPKISVMPPQTFGEIIVAISNLNDDQFDTLCKLVSGPSSFSPKKSEIDAAKLKIPSKDADLHLLLNALGFLYSRVVEFGTADQGFTQVIENLVEELEKESKIAFSDKVKLSDRLKLLLQSSENHSSYAKNDRLASGFLPNGIGFASFVDLRPSFTEGDEPRIIGYLPIVQFRVRTNSLTPSLRNFVFQLNRESLQEMKKAILRAEEKLKSTKSIDGLGPLLPEIN